MEKFKNSTNVATLIKEAACLGNKTQKELKEALDLFEEVVKSHLREATPNTDVEVKLMPGLIITSEYLPERTARDPRNNEIITVAASKRVRVKLGTNFKTAANEDEE